MDEAALKQLFSAVNQQAELRMKEIITRFDSLNDKTERVIEKLEKHDGEIQSLKTQAAVSQALVERYERDLNRSLAGFRTQLASKNERWKALAVAAPGLASLAAVLWMLFGS